MARAIWTGTVGFGLVQIPVSLHAAEDPDELDLKLLDRRDFAPVGYQRVNKVTGKEVPWEETVKGYEHADGEYVVLTDAELKTANAEASRQVDIEDFVDFSAIDPRLIERPYYLAPQKGGQKAYALLRETLHKSGKAGIGKIAIRTRQHLAALLAREEALILVLLRFADELRDEADLDLPTTNLEKLGVTRKEVAMAEQLVNSMVSDFEAKKYVDVYRRDVMRLIDKKVKAGALNQVPHVTEHEGEAPVATNVIDLATLLTQSLKSGKAPAKAAPRKPASAPKVKRASSKEHPKASGHKRSA